ncbi:alpha-mannosidase [Paenibacillus yanchengensis]|uniref:Alpha-mannosidase n=1 Tax=Paenibacillus yanchengensis TaxID=2035833 RepID=A0ABW4YJH3_9BACL
MINEKMMGKTLSKLRHLTEVYAAYIFDEVDEVAMQHFETDEHMYAVPGEEVGWQATTTGEVWGKAWSTAWFKGNYQVPASLANQKLYVAATTGGHETMFWVDGQPRGLYNEGVLSGNLGNHKFERLTDGASAGATFELAFEAYAGHPLVGTQPYQTYDNNGTYDSNFKRTFQAVRIATCREDVKAFVFDLRTLNQMVQSEHIDEFRRGKIVHVLLDVFQVLVQFPEHVSEQQWRAPLSVARELMRPLLAQKNSSSAPSAGIIGHSHMDTAWLWTMKETIRKCARTYANALELMEQYPEYIFMQSSVFHLELMRRHYPALFARIKERIAEGRWEPNGGVWIEPDCNLTSGESLVRQFMKGQHYTREHFDYTADVFWLPDTFGYSAAIPQILHGVGINYFLTTKLTWNDTNTFPYDTFYWQGLDGSTVLTHFNDIHCWPDAETLLTKLYGKGQDFRSVRNEIQHKHVNDRRLISYGFGDGGGGPQYEMLEAARRVEDLEGVPKAKHMKVSSFMEQLEATSQRIPVYTGELYFEGHRGTLTQQHAIKWNNRKAEFAMRSLEFMQSWRLAQHLPITAQSDDLYETVLNNQFHDILPGTSLPEVHDEAVRQLEAVITTAQERIDEGMASAVAGNKDENSKAITVWNTLSFARTSPFVITAIADNVVVAEPAICQRVVSLTGEKQLIVSGVTLAPLHAQTLSLVTDEASTFEQGQRSAFQYDGTRLITPQARITFDEYGYIASFEDVQTGRQLRGNGHPLNGFLMGEDVPASWDNWDIDHDQALKMQLQTKLTKREVVADGPLQFRIRSTYEIGNHSSIEQDMIFHAHTLQIDFETIVDWQDKHQLLKVAFDVNIHRNKARHEVQFGHVERPTHRNTSYDQAMFEVSNYKWTDLSEHRYGVAILNDSSYGIAVEQSDIRLTLLKGGCHPDPRGDAGRHQLTYSFLPHRSGFSTEAVIQPAYELNVPLLMINGQLEQSFDSLVQVDVSNVLIETIKPAEADQAYVIRLYEAECSATSVRLTFGNQPQRVEITNMLEDTIEQLHLDGKKATIWMNAFEIKTIKVYV